MSEAQDVLTVKLEQRPLHVGFDPEQRVTCKLSVESPTDMLRHQLEQGSNALLRWSAAEALSKKNDPASVRALADALGREGEAWMVRVEVARALGKVRSDDALAALLKGLGTSHPKVRRAVAGALGAFKKPEAAKALSRLLENEVSYLVSADAARSLGRTRQPGALEALKAAIDEPSWADVIRAGVLDGLAALRDDSALDAVSKRTRYGVPTRGRRAAVHALASLGEGKKTREQLEDLLDDKDPHFKIDVVSALTTLGDGKSRPALRRALDRELDGRVSRRLREALRDMNETPTQEKKRLTEELESVRDELLELKSRLSKLEGRKPDKPPTKPDKPPTKPDKAPAKASSAKPAAAKPAAAKTSSAKPAAAKASSAKPAAGKATPKTKARPTKKSSKRRA
jgi:aminopeptidase N